MVIRAVGAHAVAVIIAVEEPALLLPVQRVVRRIQVQDDLRRRLGVRVEEQIDEQRLDRRRVMADLMETRLNLWWTVPDPRSSRGLRPVGV